MSQSHSMSGGDVLRLLNDTVPGGGLQLQTPVTTGESEWPGARGVVIQSAAPLIILGPTAPDYCKRTARTDNGAPRVATFGAAAAPEKRDGRLLALGLRAYTPPVVLVGLFAAAAANGAAGVIQRKSPAFRGGPATSRLVLTRRVVHLDAPAREPMVVEHPSGALFVAGYRAGRPTLWKSLDRGRSWARVHVGAEADGAVGNSDVDLAAARDGTLYFVSMGYNRRAGEGTSIAVGVSRDAGTTWRWNVVSRNRFDDRPWVEVAPDGTAHLIWNDGAGVNHAVSRDRGATWDRLPRVHDMGARSSPSRTHATRDCGTGIRCGVLRRRRLAQVYFRRP